MNKDFFYINTLEEIREYNKQIEELNEDIMSTNNITSLYCYKSQLADLESKKYKDITVLLTLGYSIVDIEKDIDNYE